MEKQNFTDQSLKYQIEALKVSRDYHTWWIPKQGQTTPETELALTTRPGSRTRLHHQRPTQRYR